MNDVRILVTGGAGYIGSHIALVLLEAGHDVVIVDNYSNSSPEVIKRIRSLSGRDVQAYEADVADKEALLGILRSEKLDGVIHMAGLKAVGESVNKPVLYYRNNLDTTLTLLECMQETGIKNMVFSSSATVYGSENMLPYREDMPKGKCSNPYGWTKSMIEQILEDASVADNDLSVVLLRYFNPIGAHPSGMIGEDPKGIPNNLLPYVAQVAVGIREKLTIFGNDYATPDGTCRRDYIHVMDLAEGHLKALEYAASHKGAEVFNLGTGNPYSVLDIVNEFQRSSGVEIAYEFGARRSGDLQDTWADVSKAERVLGWKVSRNLKDMCDSTWLWQSKNPRGYEMPE